MRWDIRTKLGAVFALAGLALAALILIARRTNDEFYAAMEVRKHTQEVRLDLERLHAQLAEAESAQRGYIITSSDPLHARFNSAIEEIPPLMDLLRILTKDNDDQRRQLERLESLVPSKLSSMQEAVDLFQKKGAEPALELVRNERGVLLMQEISVLLTDMRKAEEEIFRKRTEAAQRLEEWARAVTTYGGLAVVILLGVIGYSIANNIARPIDSLAAAAQRIAGGEIGAVVVESSRSDEVGTLTRSFVRMNRALQAFSMHAKAIAAGDLTREPKAQSERDELGNAFATMTRKLREVMRDLMEAINVVSTTASQILTSTSEVAASVAETASAVTETTATVEEVKQTAQLSRDKGRLVADSAQHVTEIAQRGRLAVEDTVGGMRRIREQMDSVGASMLKLGEQTQAIGEIIATVNDLAEQSNILAVNAAIEAAKAGEHGKGFTVVAQEVRSLAEQSKQATSQVRTILGEIQKAATGAMLATEQGSKAVDRGMEQATESGASIAALTDALGQATQAAVQIAASSQQQSAGMDQVAIAIRNIQEAATQNANAVRQVEDAARNLHELGERLRALVDQYKT